MSASTNKLSQNLRNTSMTTFDIEYIKFELLPQIHQFSAKLQSTV